MKNSGKEKEVGKKLEKDGVGLRKDRHVLFPKMDYNWNLTFPGGSWTMESQERENDCAYALF